MSTIQTIRDLKVLLQQNNAKWTVNTKLRELDNIPVYHLGVEDPILASQVTRSNLANVLNSLRTNPGRRSAANEMKGGRIIYG
jgi:hypothetical protein